MGGKLVKTIYVALCSAYLACVLIFSVTDYLNALGLFIPFVALFFLGLDRAYGQTEVLSKASRMIFPSSSQQTKETRPIVIFTIIILGHSFFWAAFFPGIFNLDALGQWDQIHGIQQLNDWHPVMNTLLYWLITRLFDSVAFCIFVQIVLYAAAAARLLTRVERLGVHSYITLLMAFFMGINPAIALCNISFTKDVFFTIFVIDAYAVAVDIYASEGRSLEKTIVWIHLAVSLALATLMRHNGFFLSVPFLFLLAVFYGKMHIKQLGKLLVAFMIILVAAKAGLYPLLHAETHGNVVGESVGVPMAIMANALVNDSEHCPEETKKFLCDIADESEWREHYYIGEWDSCKWEFGGTELLMDAKLGDILHLTARTIAACPQAAYESVLQNTRVVWQVIGPVYWQPEFYVAENEYGICPGYNAMLHSAGNLTIDASSVSGVRSILWNVGFYIAVLLILSVGSLKRGEGRKMLFLLPLLAYSWGTACLLCGPSFRYFYVVLTLSLPLIVLFLHNSRSGSGVMRIEE